MLCVFPPKMLVFLKRKPPALQTQDTRFKSIVQYHDVGVKMNFWEIEMADCTNCSLVWFRRLDFLTYSGKTLTDRRIRP